MELIYIANVRIPTEKAHGIQITQMLEAFSTCDANIELIVPRRFNKIKQDPFRYYGVKRNFKITKLPCLDLVKLGKIGFLIEMISFLFSAKIYLFFRKYDILFTREWIIGLFFRNSVLEVHSLPRKISALHKRVYAKARALVVLTSFIKDRLTEIGISEDKILIAPDGVDLKDFDIDISKEGAREKLVLPQDKKIVLYVGSFYYDWKGANVLLETAHRFSIFNNQFSKNLLVVFVGEAKQDVVNYENVKFVGHRPHQEIPYWLKAADVLVLPNSAEEDVSSFYTSPLKLFEYMASGRPIVASDLPSTREILNENNAILVKPDDSNALAQGIKIALQDKFLSDRLLKSAHEDIQSYSWFNRVKKIIDFLNQ